ncbi:hypothetical protein [Deferrisoma palaeochoriense]
MAATTLEELLRAFLPPGQEWERAVPAEVLAEARRHLERLSGAGFELEPGRALLRIRNPGAGFVFTAHLSHRDDLGERRELFRALRARFGTPAERWLPWLFAASPRVAEPYESLRYLLELCQDLRNRPLAA